MMWRWCRWRRPDLLLQGGRMESIRLDCDAHVLNPCCHVGRGVKTVRTVKAGGRRRQDAMPWPPLLLLLLIISGTAPLGAEVRFARLPPAGTFTLSVLWQLAGAWQWQARIATHAVLRRRCCGRPPVCRPSEAPAHPACCRACQGMLQSQHPCGHPKCTMLDPQPSPLRRQLWRRRFRVPHLPARHPSRSVWSNAAAPQGAAMHGGAPSRWVAPWVMGGSKGDGCATAAPAHASCRTAEERSSSVCASLPRLVQDGCADGLGGTLPFQSCSLRAANCTMPPLAVSGPGVQVTTGDLLLCCCTAGAAQPPGASCAHAVACCATTAAQLQPPLPHYAFPPAQPFPSAAFLTW